MKKLLLSLLFLTMLVTGCSNGRGTESGSEETEQMEKAKLLTAAQLIRRTGIEEGRYNTAVLEQFIEDYEITEKNVSALNIQLLLEEYADVCGIKDVSGLLNACAEARTFDYTEDVAAIAFYENVGTGSECVYYDVTEGCRYRATDLYLFSDLNQTEAEAEPEGAQLAVRLEELGVFSWESVSDTESLADPQCMVLAVAYGDGTVFRIAAEGILSEVLPENYAQVRDVLLSQRANIQ